MTELDKMKIVLLDIAEGLRGELSYGHLGDFVPPLMEQRIEALSQKA